jgi:hypothetical protein
VTTLSKRLYVLCVKGSSQPRLSERRELVSKMLVVGSEPVFGCPGLAQNGREAWKQVIERGVNPTLATTDLRGPGSHRQRQLLRQRQQPAHRSGLPPEQCREFTIRKEIL